MLRDFEDDDADEEIKRNGKHEDTAILRPWCKCPTPKQCRFKDTVCEVCQRREGHYPETDILSTLATALQGGLRVEPDALPYHVWVALGLIRGRMGI